MKEIYFPGSLCPLHLGHEDFIEKIQEKTGKKIYFSIKSGNQLIKKIERLNKKGQYNYLLKKLKKKNSFLSLDEIYSILAYIYPDYKMGNDLRGDIEKDRFDGIVMGSDNFNIIINAIKKGKKDILESLKFKKIYLYERIGYKIENYKKLFKDEKIDLEIIFLGKGIFDISSNNLVNRYYNGGIKEIKKFVSKDVFNLINHIKSK